MTNDIVTLAKKFIAVPSVSDHYKHLDRVLEIALNELKGFTVEEFTKHSIPSLLIYNRAQRPKRFKVILNAHLDIAPGKKHLFTPKQVDGKLYGRGAYDMKAAAATLLYVFRNTAKKVDYPLALQLVTDEEVGGYNGTKHQIERGVKGDFVVVGEFTNLNIGACAKGVVWLKITLKGDLFHGAYPWRGRNALWEGVRFLNKLEKLYPNPKKESWTTTVNLARIENTNKTYNNSSEDCIIHLDLRPIPQDKDKLIPNVKKLLPKDAKLEIVLNESCHFTHHTNSYLADLKKAAKAVVKKVPKELMRHGGSDIRLFNEVGCDGVEFGPVGGGQHEDHEWVSISGLTDYYNILQRFLLSL